MTYPDPFLPAFPQWDGHAITSEPMYLRGGMTLRDYFAAAALTGLIAQTDKAMPCSKFAEESYKCADAMIAQRAYPLPPRH